MRSLTLLAAAMLLAALSASAAAQTCSTSWTDAAGGAWTDAASWDNGVPTATDDACITLDGTYAVTVGAFSVNSLTLGDAGNAGTQTLVASGNIAFATAGSIEASGDLEWRAGGLQAGTLTNGGLVRLENHASTRGVISSTGATLRNEGTVRHVDDALFYLYGGDARVENAGLWDVQGGGDYNGFNGTVARFTNEAGATFRKSGGDVTVFQSAPLVFENAGTVDVQTGELRFNRPSSHTDATLTAAVGGLLDLASPATFVGTITGAPAGTVQMNAVPVAGADAVWDFGGTGLTWRSGYLADGTITNAGLVRVAGGNPGVQSGTGALFRNEGTVEQTGTQIVYVYGDDARVENAGLWDIQGDGAIRGFSGAQAVFSNEAGATLRKSGGTAVSDMQTAPLVLENAGTVEALAGTFRIARPSAQTSATLTAAAGAVLELTASPTFVGTTSGSPTGTVRLSAVPVGGAGAAWDFGGTGLTWRSGYLGTGTLTNVGLVRIEGGNPGVQSNTGATFRNEGTVEQADATIVYIYGDDARVENAGLWHLLDGGDIRGFSGAMSVFANEAGGTLRKSGPGTSDVQLAPLVFENLGTVDVVEGAFLFAGASTQSGTLTTAAGTTLRFQGASPTFVGTSTGTQAGDLLLGAIPIAGAGAVWDFGGTGLQWQSGYLGTGTLTNDGLVVITNGGVNSNSGATFRNEGTVEQPSSNIVYVYGDDARVENAGLWDVLTGGDLRGFNGAMSVFANEAGGTYRVSGGSAGVFTAPLAFENAGTIDIAAGAELDLDRPFDHQGGALVQGDGTFDVLSATLTLDGDVGPGASPGVLTWQGAYAPSAQSALRIEIGGATAGMDYDQLAVSGAATLGGTLALAVADGALPTVGDSFTILTATSVAGTFASVTGPPGWAFDVVYDATEVVVTVTAVGVATELTGAEGWRMLAPSVQSQTLDGLLADRWTQGFPGSDEPGFGTPNVFLYDETAPGDAGQGYAAPGDQADGIALGTGVFAYVFADDDFDGTPEGFPKTIVQSGTDAAGAFPFGVTFTPDSGPDEDGWNLLGNPYAATLDWADPAWTRTAVDAVVYVWDPGSGQYLTHDTVAGSLPGGLVAPAQGFWVQATAPGPALTAPASARTTGGAFLGRTEAAVAELRVRRTTDADGARAASAHVVLADGAASGRDPLDAFELTSLAPDALGLWTERGDGVALDIQALAPGDHAVPVGVAAWADGAPAGAELVMTWPALPEGVAATLTDHATGEVIDLGAASEYAFTLAAGETAGGTAAAPDALAAPPRQRTAAARFTLTLGDAVVAGAPAPAFVTELLPPAPNPTRGAATLRYTVAAAGPVTVTVHDLLGRTVATLADGEAAAGPHVARLDTASLASGVYVVRMAAQDFAGVQRFTVVR